MERRKGGRKGQKKTRCPTWRVFQKIRNLFLGPFTHALTQGSYCPAKSITFVECDLGFLCSQEGLPQQSLCPSGHFCPSSKQDVPCPAGTFSSATGGRSGDFNRAVACNRACCFPRTLRAAADSHSLFRPDVCVHLPDLLPFAELP